MKIQELLKFYEFLMKLSGMGWKIEVIGKSEKNKINSVQRIQNGPYTTLV